MTETAAKQYGDKYVFSLALDLGKSLNYLPITKYKGE